MPVQYYSLTFSQFTKMLTGHKRQQYYAEKNARLIAWTIAAVNRDPKKSMPPPEKWMPLAFDEAVPKDTLDKLKERVERHKKLIEQRNGRRSEN